MDELIETEGLSGALSIEVGTIWSLQLCRVLPFRCLSQAFTSRSTCMSSESVKIPLEEDST